MSTKSSYYELDQVNVSFLESANEAARTLPIIVSPRWNDSVAFLTAWLEKNRPWVDEQILKYGALLIRGFKIDTAPEFEKATLALHPDLCDAYRGTSPRSLMPGTKYAFSAADAPVNYPIAQHLEMSFLKAPPRHLYFGCMEASDKPGGETALCDFRKVYEDLNPKLRNKLATKKIRYTRTHKKVGEKFTYDVGAMLGWPKLFETCDMKEVEKICRKEEAPQPQWTGPKKDTFVQQWIDEPFQRHPVTGEFVWFNHSQVFHWTTFPAELLYSFKRVKDIHLLIHFIFISIFVGIKYGILGYKMALTTDFGDGTPVTFSEMNEIRACIHKNMVFSRWRKGDILCIDNFSVSHGRQPTYDKGRKVIVSWSQPHDKTKAIPAPMAIQNNVTVVSNLANKQAPGLVEVSPLNSVDSTLTAREAQELKNAFFDNRFEEQMANASSQLKAAKQVKSK
jgi:alpha-ketoglutarate-dependent taurine dioxygenase